MSLKSEKAVCHGNVKAGKYQKLEQDIEAYFALCDGINGVCADSKKIPKPYTMSGLLYHTGLSKKEFDALSVKGKYSRLLLGAKARIEAYIEEKSLSGDLSSTASQTSLKYYFGWGEKEKDEASTDGRSFTVTLCEEARELAT